MSKLNKFFPYGLVDSRIINNRLCVTIFENQTAGIKSNDILVEKNEEYQLILDIRSDLSTKKYLICVDENKNQIGSRQYLEKDGKYDFRFFLSE
jgi:hypothetical protein